MKKHLIGLDIGGTKCAVTLGRTKGDDQPPEIIEKKMVESYENSLKTNG